jgi:copper transport protein
MTNIHRRLSCSAVALALTLVVGVFAPTTALAHAELTDSLPEAGQMLQSSPSEVSATFNESVEPIFFRILDKTGKEVGNPGKIGIEGTRLRLPLGDKLPNGTYVLTFRVMSSDTHAVGSSFGFSVGEQLSNASKTMQSTAQVTTRWTWAVAVNRWLLYVAMLLAAGSALFVWLINASTVIVMKTLKLGGAAAIVAAVAYVLSIGLGGAEMELAGAGALWAPIAWSRGLASTFTLSAAIGVPAMLLLRWAFARSPGAIRSTGLVVGAGAVIASFLVTGHAATASPVLLMATAVGVHLLATAFWMGAFYPLYLSTSLSSAQESGAMMNQFSRLAVLAVSAVVVSGAVISWTQLAGLQHIFGSDYGTALLGKLALFFIVLAIAAYNKIVLTPALERSETTAVTRIRRTIRIEYAVYVLILGAAMTMTLTPPPRAMAAQAAGRVNAAATAIDGIKTTVKSVNGYSVDIELTPARAGDNMLMAIVKDPNGKVLDKMADLELVATLESAGISEIRLKGKPLGNGMWHVMISEMIIPGHWTLDVEAFPSDFEKEEFVTTVDIK